MLLKYMNGWIRMTKEVLWYNGDVGCYELLDFDPNGMSNEEVAEKAWEMLEERYNFEDEEKSKVMETLYLLDVNNLERVV